MMVQDEDGLMHEVYNKRELRETYARHHVIEKWQVRTLCCPAKACVFLGYLGTEQADMGLASRGDVVTCVRCLALECDHGITFNQAAAQDMTATQIRARWPRLSGECPRGCGYNGIGYASHAHYIFGDW